MRLYFQNPRFITTAVKPEHFPKKGPSPEIAVVGRSNVGKSSLLNHLFKSKNLVKTSSTPGKTQAINFFTSDKEPIFADLPGYGYAKVSPEERAKWGELIESYLSTRPALILFLVDIRRIPSDADLQMLDWIEAHEIPAILILTKVDKLSKSERIIQTQNILYTLNIASYVHYSAVKNEGRDQLIRQICEALSSCS